MTNEHKIQCIAFMACFVNECHNDGLPREIALMTGINAIPALSIGVFGVTEEWYKEVTDFAVDALRSAINRYYGKKRRGNQ